AAQPCRGGSGTLAHVLGLPLRALGVGPVQLQIALGGRQLVLERAPPLVVSLSATLERLLEAPSLLDGLVEPALQRLELSVAPGELVLELELPLLGLGVLVAEISYQLLRSVELGLEPEQLVALARGTGLGMEVVPQLVLGRLSLGGEGPGLLVLGGDEIGRVELGHLRLGRGLRRAAVADLDHRR